MRTTSAASFALGITEKSRTTLGRYYGVHVDGCVVWGQAIYGRLGGTDLQTLLEMKENQAEQRGRVWESIRTEDVSTQHWVWF